MERRERTLPAAAWKGRATIPAVEGVRGPEDWSSSMLPYGPGDMIGNYMLTKRLCQGSQSTIFLGESQREERVAIKLYEPGTASTTPALRKLSDLLRRKGCKSLMPLLAFGDLEQGIHYEVMPVYQQGTLEETQLSEQDLRKYILPQINDALRVLGCAHLVHNDIKPANLFWKNRSKREIVLGDYDCLSLESRQAQQGEEPAGGTVLYMAPERIFSEDRIHTSASDYCSLGLTLVALLNGRPLMENVWKDSAGDKKSLFRQMSRCWQRQVSCPEETDISPEMRDVLDRLLQRNPEERYGSEYLDSWIRNQGRGVVTYHGQKKKTQLKGLSYRGQLIISIPELIEALGNDWAYGTFMMTQHQLDDFLRQFDGGYYELSRHMAALRDSSEGLFRLMQTISPSVDFYWRGSHYESLNDFVEQTEQREQYGVKDPFCHFCRMGLLSFYEKQQGATPEQIAKAEEIELMARRKPEMALKHLQISLNQKPDMVWHGVVCRDLNDILNVLEQNADKLDAFVAEFFESGAIGVWLDYIGQGSLLSEVEQRKLSV